MQSLLYLRTPFSTVSSEKLVPHSDVHELIGILYIRLMLWDFIIIPSSSSSVIFHIQLLALMTADDKLWHTIFKSLQ